MTDKGPAIVIAAGGEGARLGGSKPAQKLAGKPLLDHALQWASKHSDLVAVAVRKSGQASITSMPLLIDAVAGLGPISALKSAFDFAQDHGRDKVMLIACDLPFLPDDLPVQLDQAIGDKGCAIPVSRRRDHPMAALWRSESAALEAYIAGGQRSIWRFAETVGAVRVHRDTEAQFDPFANINDLDALAQAERILISRSD